MKVLLLRSLITVARHAHAHDLWLEKEGGSFGVYCGHKHSRHQGANSTNLELELPEGC